MHSSKKSNHLGGFLLATLVLGCAGLGFAVFSQSGEKVAVATDEERLDAPPGFRATRSSGGGAIYYEKLSAIGSATPTNAKPAFAPALPADGASPSFRGQ